MVREVDPPRPSTKVSTAEDLPNIAATRDVEPAQLKRALRGDLDWIVMKALEKDRTRRYETANGFAADILRHLAHEPVVAAPPSGAYRLRKFVRKHRGAVIAAGMVLLSLLVGIAGTTSGMIRAESRRKETEAARLAEARAREGEKQQYDRYRTAISFAVHDLRHTLESSIYTKTVQDEFGRQVLQFVDKISRADSDGMTQRAKLTLMLHEADSLRSRGDADVETVREKYARAIALAEEIDKNETTDFDLAAMNLSVALREGRRFRDREPTVRQGVRGPFEVARDCRTRAPLSAHAAVHGSRAEGIRREVSFCFGVGHLRAGKTR